MICIVPLSGVCGESAICEIRKTVPNADIVTMELDCSSFQSVRTFAKEYKKTYGNKLDVLLHNAGMASDDASKTQDGHEVTWQTNVWSACLLTQLLLPTLAEGATEEAPSRIVFVSSVTCQTPGFNIDDPENSTYNHSGEEIPAYPFTKLADWMISNALAKRLGQSTSWNGRVRTATAHPGWSSTDITTHLGPIMNTLLGMPASQGCLPQVRVSIDPTVPSGAFYGPKTPTKFSLQHAFTLLGILSFPVPELYGSPAPSAIVSPFASDEEMCEKLLQKAEEIIGARFGIR